MSKEAKKCHSFLSGRRRSRKTGEKNAAEFSLGRTADESANGDNKIDRFKNRKSDACGEPTNVPVHEE